MFRPATSLRKAGWSSEPGFNVPIAEHVRRETGIAVRAVGMIVGPKQAEAIVAEGKADMVALARALSRRSALGLACRADTRRRSRPGRCNMRARRRRYGLARLCAADSRNRPVALGADAPVRRRIKGKPQPPHQKDGAPDTVMVPAPAGGDDRRADAKWPA